MTPTRSVREKSPVVYDQGLTDALSEYSTRYPLRLTIPVKRTAGIAFSRSHCIALCLDHPIHLQVELWPKLERHHLKSLSQVAPPPARPWRKRAVVDRDKVLAMWMAMAG